ncbi:hypothetical protein ACHAW6_004615, partial [Cyclotella cf. meneghiniana]
KHPPLHTPNLSDPNNLAFTDYGKAPGIIPLDCPIRDAERVAHLLPGSAGCSGVDAKHLKNQLLKHGKASAELQEELVEWALWLANTAPPWASYQAMRQGRLVALDKQPGVRPLGIGEAWMHAVSKLLSRMAMLWEVKHRLPAGSRCAHNLYRHECRLILQGPPGTDPAILMSREGRWVTGIERLAAVASRFPHSAYAGLVSCLSAEWQYICQTVPEVGPSLAPVENALRTKFIPAILGINGPIDDNLRTLFRNGVTTGGLAIQNPTLAAASLYSTSVELTDMLTRTHQRQGTPEQCSSRWRKKPKNTTRRRGCLPHRSLGTVASESQETDEACHRNRRMALDHTGQILWHRTHQG